MAGVKSELLETLEKYKLWVSPSSPAGLMRKITLKGRNLYASERAAYEAFEKLKSNIA